MAVFLLVEIGAMFGIAFYGAPGMQNVLLLLAPVPAVALVLFRGVATRIVAMAGLVLMIWPVGIASDLLAHLLGTCLY